MLVLWLSTCSAKGRLDRGTLYMMTSSFHLVQVLTCLHTWLQHNNSSLKGCWLKSQGKSCSRAKTVLCISFRWWHWQLLVQNMEVLFAMLKNMVRVNLLPQYIYLNKFKPTKNKNSCFTKDLPFQRFAMRVVI